MPSWLTGPTCNDGSASLICDGLDGPACRDVTTLQRRVDNAWRPQAQGPSFIDSNGDPAGRRPSRERCRNGEEEEEEQGLVARQFPGLYRGPRRGDPGHRPCHRGSRCVRREHCRAPRSERQGNGQVVEEQQARKEERRPGLIRRPTFLASGNRPRSDLSIGPGAVPCPERSRERRRSTPSSVGLPARAALPAGRSTLLAGRRSASTAGRTLTFSGPTLVASAGELAVSVASLDPRAGLAALARDLALPVVVHARESALVSALTAALVSSVARHPSTSLNFGRLGRRVGGARKFGKVLSA